VLPPINIDIPRSIVETTISLHWPEQQTVFIIYYIHPYTLWDRGRKPSSKSDMTIMSSMHNR